MLTSTNLFTPVQTVVSTSRTSSNRVESFDCVCSDKEPHEQSSVVLSQYGVTVSNVPMRFNRVRRVFYTTCLMILDLVIVILSFILPGSNRSVRVILSVYCITLVLVIVLCFMFISCIPPSV